MSDLEDRTADLIALQDVKRWGVMALTRQQSVAEHCFNVMAITAELVERFGLGGGLGHDCMWWAMVHDAPECITADIDGRFKREFPEIKPLIHAAEDKMFPWYAKARTLSHITKVSAIVKAADQIETYLYIMRYGVGPRSQAVVIEQGKLIYGVRIPALAEAFRDSMTLNAVSSIIDSLVIRLRDESNNIQMRLDRVGV